MMKPAQPASTSDPKSTTTDAAQPLVEPARGPHGVVAVTPVLDGRGAPSAHFALDTTSPHAFLEVEESGNLTLHWGPRHTEARLHFSFRPPAAEVDLAAPWTLDRILLGFAGGQIPEGTYQPLCRPLIGGNEARTAISVALDRPPLSVARGDLCDFEYTLTYRDASATHPNIVVDPKIANKGDG